MKSVMRNQKKKNIIVDVDDDGRHLLFTMLFAELAVIRQTSKKTKSGKKITNGRGNEIEIQK